MTKCHLNAVGLVARLSCIFRIRTAIKSFQAGVFHKKLIAYFVIIFGMIILFMLKASAADKNTEEYLQLAPQTKSEWSGAFLLKNRATGYCLTPFKFQTNVNNVHFVNDTCGTNSQLIKKASSQYFQYSYLTGHIRSVANPDMCLDVKGGGTITPDDNLVLNPCHVQLTQVFEFHSDGTFRHYNSNWCFGLRGDNVRGSTVVTWQCNDNDEFKWEIKSNTNFRIKNRDTGWLAVTGNDFETGSTLIVARDQNMVASDQYWGLSDYGELISMGNMERCVRSLGEKRSTISLEKCDYPWQKWDLTKIDFGWGPLSQYRANGVSVAINGDNTPGSRVILWDDDNAGRPEEQQWQIEHAPPSFKFYNWYNHKCLTYSNGAATYATCNDTSPQNQYFTMKKTQPGKYKVSPLAKPDYCLTLTQQRGGAFTASFQQCSNRTGTTQNLLLSETVQLAFDFNGGVCVSTNRGRLVVAYCSRTYNIETQLSEAIANPFGSGNSVSGSNLLCDDLSYENNQHLQNTGLPEAYQGVGARGMPISYLIGRINYFKRHYRELSLHDKIRVANALFVASDPTVYAANVHEFFSYHRDGLITIQYLNLHQLLTSIYDKDNSDADSVFRHPAYQNSRWGAPPADKILLHFEGWGYISANVLIPDSNSGISSLAAYYRRVIQTANNLSAAFDREIDYEDISLPDQSAIVVSYKSGARVIKKLAGLSLDIVSILEDAVQTAGVNAYEVVNTQLAEGIDNDENPILFSYNWSEFRNYVRAYDNHYQNEDEDESGPSGQYCLFAPAPEEPGNTVGYTLQGTLRDQEDSIAFLTAMQVCGKSYDEIVNSRHRRGLENCFERTRQLMELFAVLQRATAGIDISNVVDSILNHGVIPGEASSDDALTPEQTQTLIDGVREVGREMSIAAVNAYYINTGQIVLEDPEEFAESPRGTARPEREVQQAIAESPIGIYRLNPHDFQRLNNVVRVITQDGTVQEETNQHYTIDVNHITANNIPNFHHVIQNFQHIVSIWVADYERQHEALDDDDESITDADEVEGTMNRAATTVLSGITSLLFRPQLEERSLILGAVYSPNHEMLGMGVGVMQSNGQRDIYTSLYFVPRPEDLINHPGTYQNAMAYLQSEMLQQALNDGADVAEVRIVQPYDVQNHYSLGFRRYDEL